MGIAEAVLSTASSDAIIAADRDGVSPSGSSAAQ
jgi:hypothetical protein